ncbi:hypothetical protein ACFWA5_36840 [Streptomyces mirabilis]|uniref:hypothetical protein n=1 Tax=Streptomyces mirabilis TaxID=68239 RepID=UPI00365DB6C5
MTGTVPPGGGRGTFEIGKDDPHNPTGNRFTGERFEKALKVTLNSVVFRSADQELTTAGTYIEMTSRLTEPILLVLAVLAVLAVHNRVKRWPATTVVTAGSLVADLPGATGLAEAGSFGCGAHCIAG